MCKFSKDSRGLLLNLRGKFVSLNMALTISTSEPVNCIDLLLIHVTKRTVLKLGMHVYALFNVKDACPFCVRCFV